MMQRIKQTLSAGQVVEFNIPGRYFRIDSAAVGINVTFISGGTILGSIDDMREGSWTRLDLSFDRVRIVNGAFSSDVSLLIGAGESGSDHIVGEVSVRNSAVERAISGQAFSVQFQTQCAAGSGLFAQSQLWNPANSGHNLILRRLILKTTTGSGIQGVGFSRSHLTGSGAGGPSNASFLFPKLLGATSQCVAEIWTRRHTVDWQPADLQGILIRQLAETTLGLQTYPCDTLQDLVIPPGVGLTLCINTVNISDYSTLDFHQEPIQ